MNFRFKSLKTTQAAAVLLALDGDSMDRMRLLKLLYIADRELLAESGRTLTGDRAVAMKNGPVLSRIYDLIKGIAVSPEDWGRYLRSEGYKVMLLGDPGHGELTKREIEKLHDLTERYRSVTTPLSRHIPTDSRSGARILSSAHRRQFLGGMLWQRPATRTWLKPSRSGLRNKASSIRSSGFESMKAGDTFRLYGVADRHTWVIISDPEIDDRCLLLVSFTGYYPGMDPACIVEVEEFSILDKRSCIYYEDIKEASLAALDALQSAGNSKREHPSPRSCWRESAKGFP